MTAADKSLLFDEVHEFFGGEPEDGAYWFDVLAESASFGEPQPVEVAVASLLRDGALTETQSNGNREVSLRVTIKSTDPVGLAQGLAALHLSIGKRTTLVWRDSDYPATVFDVETSSLHSPQGFDDIEYLRNEQTVTLRLVCLPFTRSADLVLDDADTPPLSGGDLLYACESTTGWAGWSGNAATYAVDSSIFCEGTGSVRSQVSSAYISTGSNYIYFYWLARCLDQVTGLSLDTDTGGYLSMAVRIEYADMLPSPIPQPGLYELYMQVDGVWEQVPAWVAVRTSDPGFVHYAWPVDAGLTVTGLRMEVRQVKWDNSGSSLNGFTANPRTWYDEVELLPAATTDKQIVKQLTVEGSARTAGSFLVAAPADTVALGEVLVITAPTEALPAGYTPDGRRWVVQGTTAADTDAPSGSYFSAASTSYSEAAGTPVFDMPAALFTAGPYTAVLGGEPQSTTPSLGVQAQLRASGVSTGVLSTAENTFGDVETGRYQFLPVGTLYLPPTPVLAPDSDVKVRMLFALDDFHLDNLYLIPAWTVGGRSVADFSIINCGTGTVELGGASSHLWLDSPGAAQPQGGYWRGPDATKALAQSAWADATKPGLHVFEPGALTAFVVSTAAQGPRVELTYYPSWFSSAAS